MKENILCVAAIAVSVAGMLLLSVIKKKCKRYIGGKRGLKMI